MGCGLKYFNFSFLSRFAPELAKCSDPAVHCTMAYQKYSSCYLGHGAAQVL